MSDFINTFKNIILRGAKLIGSVAGSVTKDIKFKISEMRELGKRRELISELGAKVYMLSKNGFELPEEGRDLVNQIASLDNDLDVLRTGHAEEKAAAAQQRAAEKAARAAEKAAAKAASAAGKSTYTFEMDFSETETPVAENSAATETTPDAPAVPTLDVEDASSAEEQPADNEIPTLHV